MTGRHHDRRRSRTGFTLVEMLVAVGIVVLMMSLFAEIFALTSGAVSAQRGIAQNDQRARILVTTIRSDLDNRTFRKLIPYDPSEAPAITTASPPQGLDYDRRRGYFYVSENDPNSDVDDVLQFTVQVPDGDPIYAKAVVLPGVTESNPDLDDDIADGVTNSRWAEVSYFVRRGILYRRVLLLRPQPENADAQPKDGAGDDVFSTVAAPGTLDHLDLDLPDTDGDGIGDGNGVADTFWALLDQSAHHDGYARFHGLVALNNSESGGTTPTLGLPWYRFGHFRQVSGDPNSGQPREFVSNGFIGRFTHEETSHPDFQYPQALAPADPFDPATALNLDGAGVVATYANGPRRAEDVIMANVLSFDVKVWDPGEGDYNQNSTVDPFEDFNGNGTIDPLNEFVDVGHGFGNGLFSLGQRANPAYGPQTAIGGVNRVFDTWHANVNGANAPYPLRIDSDGSGDITANDTAIPLRAIQIQLRFRDTTSGQIRQLTIQQALTD